MQSMTTIADTTTLQASLSAILNNDKTALSCSSGTAFPTAELQLGMMCFRTDQLKLYQLQALTPTWTLIADLATSAAIAAITGLSNATPAAPGTAAAGTGTTVARSDHVHAAPTSVSGNAGTATKLATARTITFSGGATGSFTFDGSADVASVALSLSGNAPTATTATTATTANAVNTANTYQVNGLGVGTAPSATAGEIRATNNITAYYSDGRLKTVLGTIKSALQAVLGLRGVIYKNNEIAAQFGYETQEEQVGVIAQEVQTVLPQVVTHAPFDIGQNEDGTEYSKSGENYLTVRYERLVPLLIEAIKEQQGQIEELKGRVGALEAK